jgi:hypothetical protein
LPDETGQVYSWLILNDFFFHSMLHVDYLTIDSGSYV